MPPVRRLMNLSLARRRSVWVLWSRLKAGAGYSESVSLSLSHGPGAGAASPGSPVTRRSPSLPGCQPDSGRRLSHSSCIAARSRRDGATGRAGTASQPGPDSNSTELKLGRAAAGGPGTRRLRPLAGLRRETAGGALMQLSFRVPGRHRAPLPCRQSGNLKDLDRPATVTESRAPGLRGIL